VSKVTEKLVDLAKNRVKVVELKSEEKDLWAKLEENAAYVLWKNANDRRMAMEKEGTAIRYELGSLAVCAHREGEAMPDQIQIVMQRRVEFSNGILEWSKKNVPAMLVLEEKALTKMVLGLNADQLAGMGIPALVIETPDIRVDSDLSAVLID
jgi:hypothetical protein